MSSFKVPTFQDRAASAAVAKNAALDKLRAKPPIDPAILAERKAAQDARDEAVAQASRDKKAARDQEKAEIKARAAEAAAAVAPVELTAEEKKAIRDARYAARKNRAGR